MRIEFFPVGTLFAWRYLLLFAQMKLLFKKNDVHIHVFCYQAQQAHFLSYMYVLHAVCMVCYLLSKEPCFPRKWPWQCIKDLNAIKKYYYWYTIILLQIIGLYKRGFSLNSIPVIFKINTPLGTCCTDSFPCVTLLFSQKSSVTRKFALQGLNLCIIKEIKWTQFPMQHCLQCSCVLSLQHVCYVHMQRGLSLLPCPCFTSPQHIQGLKILNSSLPFRQTFSNFACQGQILELSYFI